jgi:hypothetical protein
MPFTFEPSDKSSHSDIVRSLDVAAFLGDCEYDRIPSAEEGRTLGQTFAVVPDLSDEALPSRILAVDGSPYSSQVHPQLVPSTAIGYVKVSALLILMDEYKRLRAQGTDLVDPFRLAQLQDRNKALIFALPGPNVRYRGHDNLKDGFRDALDRHLLSEQTRHRKEDPRSSLRSTLFHVVAHMEGYSPDRPDEILLHRCPNDGCYESDILVRDVDEEQVCPGCEGAVYPSDFLRLYEGVTEDGPSGETLTRLMLVLEHLIPIHHIRYLREQGSHASIAEMAVFMDGPLALFGNPAKLHSGIMGYYHALNRDLESRGLQRLLVMGLQKTGRLAEQFNLIKQYVPKSRVMPVSDEYRNAHITPGRRDDPTDHYGHGAETYYGQDFLFRSANGGMFVISLPYPFPTKASADRLTGESFKLAKSRPQNYVDLVRTLALVERFETSLYPNALVPIALAHQFTAISLMPGAAVLNMLTERTLRARAPDFTVPLAPAGGT